ncbi:DNA polymerase epsilon subunit 2-like [Oscarella lobularis]|uniref:DNA polymerase epsilon subunit 2-like n=1 Tax=Oscarella lobularis TaxID=121494 RepID=UPI003313EB25
MAGELKSKVLSSFKLHGLSLRSDASRRLCEALAPVSRAEVNMWLDKIVDVIQKQPLTSSLLDLEVIELAIEECGTASEQENDQTLQVIDAFSIPRLVYNNDRKKFLLNSASKPCLHASADAKTDLFKERYMILYQRTMRHRLFIPPVPGSAPHQDTRKFQLKTVEYLLGTTAKLGRVIVLGMLTQMKEGKYFIEDPTGTVELDIAEAVFHSGIFTENCFVLAEGTYDDKIFHVSALGFPPAEPSNQTREYFGSVNFFGGSSERCAKHSTLLAQAEKDNQDAMFVFLSEVWLDHPKVMDKLQTLFTGYSDMPPTVFVLCGHFCSMPYGPNHVRLLKQGFRDLADLICKFPNIAESSHFVFVPGPLDIGPGNILPRPPIPDVLTEDIRSRVPLVTFASNPCRFQYCTQEIIVFREDITNKMCRNCLRFPGQEESIPSHLVKTITTQAHLCPLPLHVRPIYWSYDNALRVYPLPDLIVLADAYDPFQEEASDCRVINPGAFPKSKFQFKVYWPQKKLVENSQLPD